MEEDDVKKYCQQLMKSNSSAPVTIDINSKDKTDLESSPEWFYNAVTKIYESNSNFFIPAIKLWQTYTSLFGASNEIGKAWMNMIVGWTRLYERFNSIL